MTTVGLGLMSAGGALYLSARLGASPIDGLMTALYRRGRGRAPLHAVRTGLELTALAAGWAAGGTVGIGTLIVGLGIGPGLHFCLRLLQSSQQQDRVARRPQTSFEVGVLRVPSEE